MAGYIILPTFAFGQLMRNFKLVNEKSFENTYGALYQGLKTKNGRKVLAEPIVFLLRRIFIAWVVIYGRDLFFFMQINLVFAVSILQIATPYIVDS